MQTDANKKKRISLKNLKLKKLTPEQKQKAISAYEKISGSLVKYAKTGVKPKISVEPKVNVKFDKQSFSDFWDMPVNLGIIKPTRKQLAIGTGTAIALGIAFKKMK